MDNVIRLIAKGNQQQKLIDEYDDHELSVVRQILWGSDRHNKRGEKAAWAGASSQSP